MNLSTWDTKQDTCTLDTLHVRDESSDRPVLVLQARLVHPNSRSSPLIVVATSAGAKVLNIWTCIWFNRYSHSIVHTFNWNFRCSTLERTNYSHRTRWTLLYVLLIFKIPVFMDFDQRLAFRYPRCCFTTRRICSHGASLGWTTSFS